eukprot:1156671-Pelagomonas_calceolata.AAC.6
MMCLKTSVDIQNGGVAHVTPRNFKDSIGRFAPQFSGYAQHDSQVRAGWEKLDRHWSVALYRVLHSTALDSAMNPYTLLSADL